MYLVDYMDYAYRGAGERVVHVKVAVSQQHVFFADTCVYSLQVRIKMRFALLARETYDLIKTKSDPVSLGSRI